MAKRKHRFHYTGSGLDNVWLEDGFRRFPGGGYALKNPKAVHRWIAQQLVAQIEPLIGAEHRYLRLEMNLSLETIAAIYGVSSDTVHRWERNRQRPIPNRIDREVRQLYKQGGKKKPISKKLVLRKIAELPQTSASSIQAA
jgi:putative transcriptional regulator